MRKILLMMMLCVMSVVGAWAQGGSPCGASSGIAAKHVDGTKVTYTLHGDMAGAKIADNAQTVFTSNAVNNVFTNSTGTSVAENNAYNSENQYYYADKDWSVLFGGGQPVANTGYATDVTVNSTWKSSVDENNIYPITIGASKAVWDESKTNSVFLYPLSSRTEVVSWNAESTYLYETQGAPTTGDKWTTSALTADGVYVYPVTLGATTSTWNAEKVQGKKFSYWYANNGNAWKNSDVTALGSAPASYEYGSVSYNETEYTSFCYTEKSWEEVQGEYGSLGDAVTSGDVVLLTKEALESFFDINTPLTVSSDRLVSGSYSAPGTYIYDGVTYPNYILSSVGIPEGVTLSMESLPATVTLLTSMDAYHGNATTVRINSDRITTGQLPYYNGTKFQYNDNSYIKYVTSSVELANGQEVDVNAVTLCTEESIQSLRSSAITVTLGDRIISGNHPDYIGSDLSYNDQTYVWYGLTGTEHNSGDVIKMSDSDLTLMSMDDINAYFHDVHPVTVGAKLVSTDEYSTPESFTYNENDYVKYIISTSEIAGGTTMNIEDFSGQSLMTASQLNNHVNVSVTYNCASDVMYVSTDGGTTKEKLTNGQQYTYTPDQTFWSYSAVYREIVDNESYFGTDHADYIAAKQVAIAEYIVNECNAAGYTDVILESCSCGYATMDQNFTCQLLHLTTATTLDLSKVQVPALVGGAPTTAEATFKWDPNSTTDYTANNSITTLYLPHIQNAKMVNEVEHRHVTTGVVGLFAGLKNSGIDKHESTIYMPDNATCIEKDAFTGMYLTDINLNEGLKMVGPGAFDTMHEKVLVIPSTMEYIGKGSFGQGYVTDVYFLGDVAPIVEMDAFGSKAYVCNNANIVPGTQYDPIILEQGSNPEFLASRANYYNNDYAAALLHLRTDLSPAQRATFTDVTRDYHVFDTYRNAKQEDDPSIVVSATEINGNKKVVYQIEGNDHESEYYMLNGSLTPWTSGINTADYIMYTCWNGDLTDDGSIASKGAFQLVGLNRFYSGVVGAEVAGGNTSYYDRAVGKNYQWPSQTAHNRSYSVATNALLWDGKTTIAGGIGSTSLHSNSRNADITISSTLGTVTYDINCDGDTDDEGEAAWENGSEFIGVHQFVLVTNDTAPTTTIDEWDFNTLGGENWYTICVPVDMTVAEVRKAFGPETQVCEFNKVERDANDKIKFYFTAEQCLGKESSGIAIHANKAYMIRPSNFKDATYTFKLPDYKLSDRQVPEATIQNCVDPTNGKTYTYIFVGQYNTKADGSLLYMPKYSYYLGADPNNTTYHRLFLQVGETGKWKPYTCVILNENGQDDYDTFFDPDRANKQPQQPQQAKTYCSFGLDNYDDGASNVPTAIMSYEIICGSEEDSVYNLSGQKVNSKLLRKGIYVKNGKTFIVK